MSKKMLIDAAHPEETRVVIVNGSRIEELDFESQAKRQLRGNVYLARVTRVEPSLQAAFVEYGGNRHGFLAFSEIHPDYYQIPYEDRMALIEEEEAETLADEKDDEDDADQESEASEATSDEDADAEATSDNEGDDEEEVAEEQEKTASTRRRRMSHRRYKIQEVIKRGQILLIQAVKEERGNKGAAMTTYLSLAGRYCVLMPNTPRGGGISRKISNGADRKRLKAIVSEFDVPQGMGVIVRTAGAKRNKSEIKRDYDYLSRLWETVRNTTLKSIAPALIHEEGDLVKRSIRDLYNKDIDEVLVQGDEAYKDAKAFMKMLMPSHAKNVKAYKEDIPLFLRYRVESQIEDSLKSEVQLKSGGYLVIHPTEALVSVDVNSGRSTKERNVERTALKTNLEAAEEVARQMRLRDLAGLVVIDFIDMDENRNNRAVEKRMKEALSRDRARVQAGRISQFGLMEISRQRRRRSLLEGSTVHCDHCGGVGRKRSVESSALKAIRAVEETGVRGQAKRIRLTVAPDVALYIFNEKRDLLQGMDDRFNMFTELTADETLLPPDHKITLIRASDTGAEDPLIEIEKELKKQANAARQAEEKNRRNKKKKDTAPSEDDTDAETPSADDTKEDGEGKKRRRRRGRRGGRRRNADAENAAEVSEATDSAQTPEADTETPAEDSSEKPKRRRRRAPSRKKAEDTPSEEVKAEETEAETPTEDKPKRRSTTRRKAPTRKKAEDTVSEDTPAEAPAEEKAEAKPKRTRRRKAAPKADTVEETPATEEKAEKPKRSTTRRKAPARKKAETSDATPAAEEKAPAPAEEKTAAPAEEKPKRSTARRKAPARKKAEGAPEATEKPKAPARKRAPKKETEDKPKRNTARRKAPSRKVEPEDKEAEPAPQVDAPAPAAEPVADVPKDEAPAEAPKKKRRGWLGFGRKS